MSKSDKSGNPDKKLKTGKHGKEAKEIKVEAAAPVEDATKRFLSSVMTPKVESEESTPAVTSPKQIDYEFIPDNDKLFVRRVPPVLHTLKEVPPAVYSVKFHPMQGYYLQLREPFKLPKRVYGDAIERAEEVLSGFTQRAKNVGTMFAGHKGAGKTLAVMATCQMAVAMGMPVLVIDKDPESDLYFDEGFREFLQMFTQETVVFWDEYEKKYTDDQQAAMLSLLDGTYQSRKLWLLTCNDKFKVNQYLQNRTGRILYWYTYEGLEQSVMMEYGKDNLKNQEYLDDLRKIHSIFLGNISFDCVTALVEEANLRERRPLEVLPKLNIQLPTWQDGGKRYKVDILKPSGETIDPDFIEHRHIKCNPNFIGLDSKSGTERVLRIEGYAIMENGISMSGVTEHTDTEELTTYTKHRRVVKVPKGQSAYHLYLVIKDSDFLGSNNEKTVFLFKTNTDFRVRLTLDEQEVSWNLLARADSDLGTALDVGLDD